MKCEQTGKNIWSSERAARYAAKEIMKGKGGEGVEPTRYYHCCHCEGWHYTAIPYSNVFVFFGCFWFKKPETGASIGMQIFFNQHAVNARMVVGERLLYQRMFHCAGRAVNQDASKEAISKNVARYVDSLQIEGKRQRKKARRRLRKSGRLFVASTRL